MLTYFIVLTWWAGVYPEKVNPFADPVISVYESAQAACSDDKKVKEQNGRARSRIWQLTPITKDGFTLKEGSCQPRREFIFQQ